MITTKILEQFPKNTIFAYGTGFIEHPWFNQAKTIYDEKGIRGKGKLAKVRWVAITGGINDWAIYHSLDANFVKEDYLDDPDEKHLEISLDRIAMMGAKLYNKEDIKRLVPCDEESFNLYRY